MKAPFYSALISCSGVLEAKRHGDVAVGVEQSYGESLDAVVYVEGDLVIPRVGVEEGE